jgi:hypothetical protein
MTESIEKTASERLFRFLEKIVERGASVVGGARNLLGRGGGLMVRRSRVPGHCNPRLK